MKIMKTSIAFATGSALLIVSANLFAQPFSEGRGLPKNRAVLSSPRTLEQFPELLRSGLLREREPAEAKSRTERLSKLTGNRALAASPRFLEEHPELLRPRVSAEELLARASARQERLFELTENRALANSPRFLEAHPEILRSTTDIQIAPLK